MPYNNHKKNSLNNIPLLGQIFIALLLIYGAWKASKIIKAANKTGKDIVSDIKGSTQINEVKAALHESGITDVRSDKVQEAADDIFAAFYQANWWGGEDEEKAIDALNNLLSIAECKAAARIYKSTNKKSMATDFTKYCFQYQLDKIKASHLKAIKGI